MYTNLHKYIYIYTYKRYIYIYYIDIDIDIDYALTYVETYIVYRINIPKHGFDVNCARNHLVSVAL